MFQSTSTMPPMRPMAPMLPMAPMAPMPPMLPMQTVQLASQYVPTENQIIQVRIRQTIYQNLL